jgi:predicted ABC-type ATPase
LAIRNESFAFETTLASRSYLRWLTGLRRDCFTVHILFLWLRSEELAVSRVLERVRHGGHYVPAEVIRRRYRAGLTNLFQLYMPVADSWRVFDNSALEPIAIASGAGSKVHAVNDADTWHGLKESGGG